MFLKRKGVCSVFSSPLHFSHFFFLTSWFLFQYGGKEILDVGIPMVLDKHLPQQVRFMLGIRDECLSNYFLFLLNHYFKLCFLNKEAN